MFRGVFYGSSIIFIANTIWLISEILPILFLSAFFASLIASSFAVKLKFLHGVLMSVVFGISMMINSIITVILGGKVDGYYYGFAGLWAFSILSLPVCIIGAFIGALNSANKQKTYSEIQL